MLKKHIDLPVGEVLKVVIYVKPTRGRNKADNENQPKHRTVEALL